MFECDAQFLSLLSRTLAVCAMPCSEHNMSVRSDFKLVFLVALFLLTVP